MGVTYFIQICPTCGRRLEVKIEYIGLEVSCYHCRARFLAENVSHQQQVSEAIVVHHSFDYCSGKEPLASHV